MNIAALDNHEQIDLVRQAVSAVCFAPLASLHAQTAPPDVKGWDSFGRLQVVLELERLVGRELPLERTMAAGTIGEIAAVLAENYS